MTRAVLADPSFVPRITRTMAMRKLGRAEDVARVVVALASDEISGHVTGEVVTAAPDWPIGQAAAVMGLSPAYLESVASFYDLFRLEPTAKHRVLVCHNISCWMQGADGLLEAFCDDGAWSVAQCIDEPRPTTEVAPANDLVSWLALVLAFIVTTLPPPWAGIGVLVWVGTTLLTIVDEFILVRRLKKELARRFPGESKKGITLYTILRTTQLRRFRLPKPQVKRFEVLTDDYR